MLWRMLGVFSGVLCLADVAIADGIEHRDPRRHFILQIPEGWIPLPPEVLGFANEMGARAKVRYDTGFQSESQPFGQGPYLLIQIDPAIPNGMSYEQIEAQLRKSAPDAVRQAKGAMGDFVKTANLGTWTLDRANNRVVTRAELSGVNGKHVQGVSYTMFGKAGTVSVHCYADKETFEASLPLFNRIADSFHFDPGYELKLGAPGPVRAPAFDLPGVVVGGAVAGAAAGLVVGIRKLLRKSQARRANNKENAS